MTQVTFNSFSIPFIIFLCLTITQSSFAQNQQVQQELILKFKDVESVKKSRCGSDLSACIEDVVTSKKSVSSVQVEELSSILTENTFTTQFNSSVDIDDLIQQYEATGLFEYVERNHIENPIASYPVPTYPTEASFSNQWGFKNTGHMQYIYSTDDADIDMEYAWSIEKGNAGLTVAILDTGVDYTNPDLSNRVWTNPAEIADNGIDDDNNGYIDDMMGYDFAESNPDPQDIHGHGTHIAGIIGADAYNGSGFVGLDWGCKLMLLKVVRDNMTSSYTDYAEAVVYAADHGAKVINMSLTSYYGSTILEQAFQYAHAKGVVIVVAMGNNGNSTTHYMAKSQYSIAVGATTPSDKRASYSNYKDYIDVVAPGSYIYGLKHSDHNATDFKMNGTSQATAYVSGLASLLLAQNPNRSPEDIRNIMRITAEDQIGPSTEDVPGFDYYYGYGRINAYEALAYEPGMVQVMFNSQEALTISEEPASESDNGQLEEESSNCMTAIQSEFEDGFGAWFAGGSDAHLSDNSGVSNSKSIKLVDNSGASSSIMTTPFNATQMTAVDLSFAYYPLSMERGEDFMFELSVDGGETFSILRSWVSGVDFENREFINESVLLSDLSLTDQTVFRFRCDASSNSDYIFLDNIVINLCGSLDAVNCTGVPCDDGNACTVDDMYTAECDCVGTFEDKDNDGFCVGEDVDDLDSCLPDSSACGDVATEEELADCAIMSYSNFDSESEFWVLGGLDAMLRDGAGLDGSTAVKLRDNSGIESSIYTQALDLSAANQVSIDFTYYGSSMEAGEGFVFELSMDNGRSYIEIKNWVSGVDFVDRKPAKESIYIPESYLTDQTIFRFKAEGSSTGDAVYLDDIAVSVCLDSDLPENGVASVVLTDAVEDVDTENIDNITDVTLSVFPNPTIDYINLNLQNISGTDYDVHIYTLGGAQVFHSQFSVGDEVRIDVSAFHDGTQYILSVVTPQSTSSQFTTTFFKK